MALAALAGAMFLWSGTFIAMKVALGAFHPVFMTFTRMLCGTLLLLPFMRGLARASRYSPGDWRIIAVLVVCEPCLYFLFEGYALRYTTASQAGMVTALLPLCVGAGAFVALNERLAPLVWAGFFLAVGGVIWLTLAGESSETAPNPLLGNFLELCAMVMATGYTLCVRRLSGYHPFALTAMQAAGGAIFFGLMLLLMPGAELPEAFPPLPCLMLLFLAMASVIAYSLYNIGIARLGAGRAAAWTNLIPAVTVLMGIAFLGETLNLWQSLSLVPILAGVVLSQCRQTQRPGPVESDLA